jgi:hypothetical protein
VTDYLAMQGRFWAHAARARVRVQAGANRNWELIGGRIAGRVIWKIQHATSAGDEEY